MAQDVNVVKNIDVLDTRDALCDMSHKCGERPYLFATIVVNAKILLDIAALYHLLQIYFEKLLSTLIHYEFPFKIDFFRISYF